jgi:hypothetical protein
MSARQIVRGTHVAHVAIDDPLAGAKTGIVEEYVGDEEAGVVIMRAGDGAAEGYDIREIVPLHNLGWMSKGPVILSARHLWTILRRPGGLLSVILAVVLATGLVALSDRYHWSGAVIVAAGLLAVALLVALVLADQRELHRSPHQ